MAKPSPAAPHAQAADLFGAALGRCDTGIVVLDGAARIVFWNLWMVDASGVPVAAAQGRTLNEVFPEADVRRLDGAVARALASRQTSVLSRALNPRLLPLRRSGEDPIEHQAIVKPLDARGGQFCLVQIYDVTDAVHRERFLRSQASDLTRLAAGLEASEGALRAMLEASPIGVAILSGAGTIRFANPRLAELFLADGESIVGANASDFFTHPRNLLSRLDRNADRVEVQFRRRDGSLLWAQVTARPMEFEKAPAVLCWLYDISEHKQAEQSLADERDRAAELVKARTEFLAMVSHEIRTPLNGIMGTVRMLEATALGPGQREYLDTIRYSGDALLTILNDVLDISKLEAGHISLEQRPFDIVFLVENLVLLMSGRAGEKGLSLRTEVAPGIPRDVVSDPGRLRQVLLNLIGNAIKFTEAGGVTVRLERIDEGAARVRLRFAIIDTGVGIGPAAKAKLFTEFFQVDPTAARRLGGTGLGLAICRRIVEAMGGAIGVESTEGVGSTFWFTLSFEKAEPLAPVRSPVTAATRPCRVLLVEDNEINQKVALNLLRRDGHEVVLADTGTEALRLAAEGGFDVILMDIQLPEMDGIETTRRIRTLPDRTVAATPIVALTANVMPGEARRFLDAGMVEVLTKPIEPESLAQALARAVTGRPAPAAPDAGIDHAVLDSLRAAIGAAKVDELIELFRTTGRATIDEIVAAAAAGRPDTCAALAHRLKGGALNLGLGAVSAAAVAVESAVADGCGVDALELLVNDLSAAYQATIDTLRG